MYDARLGSSHINKRSPTRPLAVQVSLRATPSRAQDNSAPVAFFSEDGLMNDPRSSIELRTRRVLSQCQSLYGFAVAGSGLASTTCGIGDVATDAVWVIRARGFPGFLMLISFA